MLDFIDINGEKHPIIVNFYVIGLFQQETGQDLSSLADIENKLYLVEPLMYYALKTGYLINKQEFPYTRADMPLLLMDNDIYKKFTAVITKFFPTSTETNPSKKKKV
jgi:hypothetical protein